MRLPKLLIPAAILALLIGGAVWLYAQKATPSHEVGCTMEAKMCPDGSYVGRSGPNCEFTPCPLPTEPAPTPKPVPDPVPEPQAGTCAGEGASCQQGYRCVQDCGPPVVRENDPAPAWHCLTEAEAAKPRMCPICLASNSMIATPSGSVSVKEVKVGTIVSSVDAQGRKVASRVLRVTRTPVPSSHLVTHLTMTDGREVWASPDHPTADGRRVADVQPGDEYDGIVAVVETVPYWDTDTYDLLPDSATGFYWANGVLLGSTLFKR